MHCCRNIATPPAPTHPHPHTHPPTHPHTHTHTHGHHNQQLHGTCLGFETLAVIASGNHSILSDFDAEDYASPLYPTELAGKSRFFRRANR